MSEPSKDDQLPEAEANERFRKLVGNLVKTPHKPHKPSVVDKTNDGNRNRNRGG